MFFRFIFICVAIYCSQESNALECASENSTIFKLVVNSHRNATGHWNAQIQFGHGAEHDHTEAIHFDIEQITTKCPSTENFLVVANIKASQLSSAVSDYELVPGKGYYKLHTEPQTWHAARVICYQEGGYLAILNSNFEFSILKMLFDRHPKMTDDWRNQYGFLGISDIQSPKNFVTVFGAPINDTGYTRWHPGQPNYDGNCIGVLRSGLLNDLGCDNKLPFFCEKPL